MKSKNCQKVVLKALGHILYGSNFIASDVSTGVYRLGCLHFWPGSVVMWPVGLLC